MICIVAIVIFILTNYSCSTSYQIQTGSENLVASDSVLKDRDGNSYSLKLLRDGNLWMTANLMLNNPGSYCYGDKQDSCHWYGRLYTWESAQQGCSSLDEGWELPTKDDWQRLASHYGTIGKDSAQNTRAYHPLLSTGHSGFNAVLGGGRNPDGSYARLEAHGFYWTATEWNDSTAWFANFAKGSQALYVQNNGEKTRAFSVRCVKRTKASR